MRVKRVIIGNQAETEEDKKECPNLPGHSILHRFHHVTTGYSLRYNHPRVDIEIYSWFLMHHKCRLTGRVFDCW